MSCWFKTKFATYRSPIRHIFQLLYFYLKAPELKTELPEYIWKMPRGSAPPAGHHSKDSEWGWSRRGQRLTLCFLQLSDSSLGCVAGLLLTAAHFPRDSPDTSVLANCTEVAAEFLTPSSVLAQVQCWGTYGVNLQDRENLFLISFSPCNSAFQIVTKKNHFNPMQC